MKMLGYVLLIGGFLWLMQDAVISFAHYHHAATADTLKVLQLWGDPVPRGDVFRPLWGLYYLLKARYRIILLPACLMLAGALLLGVRRYPEIIVQSISNGEADTKPGVNKMTRDPAGTNRMRKLGYSLLVVGLLWLVQDAATGFAHYQYVTTDNIAKGMLPWGERVPRSVAFGSFWDLYNHLKVRYRLILLPGCLMLAGGLMLGAQKRPAIIIERNFIGAAGVKTRVDEFRRDYPAARRPEKGGRYHRALLGLARRAMGRSAYFRSGKPKEHVDEHGP